MRLPRLQEINRQFILFVKREFPYLYSAKDDDPAHAAQHLQLQLRTLYNYQKRIRKRTMYMK